jgi:hypothetical protein
LHWGRVMSFLVFLYSFKWYSLVWRVQGTFKNC